MEMSIYDAETEEIDIKLNSSVDKPTIKNGLDQFYTKDDISSICIAKVMELVDESKRAIFIEPSAGYGSFSKKVPNCIAYDIDPKDNTVIKKDFLKVKTIKGIKYTNNVCAIGNPPFGKNSSLAIKFFNHLTIFADTIALILPRTFRKQSVHNKLNLEYSLDFDMDIPKKGFIYNGEEYDVPCCFQIWSKKNNRRETVKDFTSEYIVFSKKEDCDFAIRRVGGTTGRARLDYNALCITSHYFVKNISGIKTNKIIEIINSINFSIVRDTAGVRSLSKPELVRLLNDKIGDIYVKKSNAR